MTKWSDPYWERRDRRERLHRRLARGAELIALAVLIAGVWWWLP